MQENGSNTNSGTEPARFRDSFLTAMKTLNEEYISSIRSTIASCPFGLLTPLIQTYLNDVSFLKIIHQVGNEETPSDSMSSSFSSVRSKEDIDDDEDDIIIFQQCPFDNENGSLFKKRCVVYEKCGSLFKRRGIGMLYVKKNDEGKHQLIVRANENVGTLLLSTNLERDLSIEKFGRKSISTFEVKDQVEFSDECSIILRTTSEQDATELLKTLKQYQTLSF